MPKSKHEHEYYLFLKQVRPNMNGYDLMQKCSICGKERTAPYKMRLLKENGKRYWLWRKEDIFRVYGELPVVEVLYDNE